MKIKSIIKKFKKTENKFTMKKTSGIFILILVALISTSVLFAANSKKSTPPMEKPTISTENQDSKYSNQEIEKLNRILFSMSDRAKQAIPNGNPQEFLDDLYKVLASDSNNNGDVSLFYLIDKKHNIGSDYVPKGLIPLTKNDDYIINKTTLSLRPEAYENLTILAKAAKKDGITLDVSSTYRSYEYQERTFNYWVSVDGLEEAERESARPGTSQHQLGVAIDFGNIEDSFARTESGKWLSQNAAKYGWSLSFPQGYEDVTGYRWECWHYRYIGIEACEFQKKWFGNIQQFMLEFINEWKK